MEKTYLNLIKQNYSFPTNEFLVKDNKLFFHNISIDALIKKYGSPFKLFYLPQIRKQIKTANSLFNKAIKKYNYSGNYNFCYCTKSCHFAQVINTVLQAGSHLETSSAFDIDLVMNLHQKKLISKTVKIIHNEYKTESYLKKIIDLNKLGFINSYIVLDSKSELKKIKKYLNEVKNPLKIGLRVAIDEAPDAMYYTSRLGIRSNEIFEFYQNEIKDQNNLDFKMVHFYVDSGIKDTFYYWTEFSKVLEVYAQLKEVCSSLNALNIGGGFPIKNNLNFNYDYEKMIDQLVNKIKTELSHLDEKDPDIYTEFGKYTVGESAATIFKILDQKMQNKQELWYILDNSLINTIPDTWSISEKFMLLPINKWDNAYVKVNVGGISCDRSDFYNWEGLDQRLILPTFEEEGEEPLYIGFFNTGAYQDAISGYGGIRHCLIPAPKIVIVDKDENGKFFDYMSKEEQNVDDMLSILGY